MFEADVLIVSILILCVISYSYANTCNAFFKVKSICNTNYGTPLRRYTDNQSKAKCALACSQDASCFSSVFDSHTGVFQTFPEYKSLGECVTEEFYSAVFQSTCHVPPVIPGQILSRCDINSECRITDSECRNTKCRCKPGLSHDPGSNTCVTDCNSYGSTFQEDLGHLLVALTDGAASFTDINTCFSACVTETSYVCRTVEIWKDGSVCYFSKDTANSTEPTARQANPGYDLYQRDCAP